MGNAENPGPGGLAELTPPVEQAVWLAAQLEQPAVGPRELLFALAAAQPTLVIGVAGELGLDGRRLAWTLSEWWPTEAPAGPRPTLPLSGPFRQALGEALAELRQTGLPPRLCLARSLLRRAGREPVQSADAPAPSSAPTAPTNRALLSLALI